MRALLLLSIGCCWFTAGVAAEESIVKNVKSLRQFRVASEEFSADGASAKLVFECPDGIFSFDLDLGKHNITKLVFVIRDTAHWEGVEFTPTGKKQPVDLKTTPGVSIKADGKDCVITLTGAGLDLLKKGGRFQFINLYRG